MSERRVIMLAALIALWQGVPAAPCAAAEELSAQQAIESAREALRGPVKYPWYDPQTDQLRPVDLEPTGQDGDQRDSAWEATPQKKAQRQSRRTSWAWWGRGFTTVLKICCWVLLCGLLAALVAMLIRAYLKGESAEASAAGGTAAEESQNEAERVERLPFPVRLPQTDLLSHARQCYEQGRYGEAVVYLFSYQLVQLDKRQCIALAKGKTNRQYLSELAPSPELVRIVAGAMVAFEEVFFGDYRMDRDRCESLWRSLDQFHQQLELLGA